MLVTEWVDGIGFDQVVDESDAVRDRYAEIVYRFFYANAGELDLALGDPHPGNYLLRDDGRVAFFDFGMIRELPRGYLAREAQVFAALRDSDASALRRHDARARLPARALGGVERRDAARADARGRLVVSRSRAAAARARGPLARDARSLREEGGGDASS